MDQGMGKDFGAQLRKVIDVAIEAPVVTSFTRIGHDVRSRLDGWTAPAAGSMDGRVVVITGGTSGLGRVAARELAELGATVVITGRDAKRTDAVAAELSTAAGVTVEAEAADMGNLAEVRSLAERIVARHPAIDVLVHNAGALSNERRTTSDGIEQTLASQVVGPFLLTSLLLPALRAAVPSRVITMSSGGMYASNLEVDAIEMDAASYKGAEQYARAKRAQVTLNEMWAERFGDSGIVFHAMHPGWADTPGVEESLPTFRKIVGPLLRTPEQGADTLVWLAADPGEPSSTSGTFWLDRRRRSIHRLPTTRRSDTPERRVALWAWCVERAGIDPVTVPS
jgi:NAD(P)-dependent dehydrogenase (short-subunit alcohol dehydrogenase family)